MFRKFIDKVALLRKLYRFFDSIEIEYHNENSYNWSNGYKKGAMDTISIVEGTEAEVVQKTAGDNKEEDGIDSG